VWHISINEINDEDINQCGKYSKMVNTYDKLGDTYNTLGGTYDNEIKLMVRQCH
jgi:hypothetical protein